MEQQLQNKPDDTNASNRELERQFDEVIQRRADEQSRLATQREDSRSVWRTHHRSDAYHRCATVGGRLVCRRCSVMYPAAFVSVLAGYAGLATIGQWSVVMIWASAAIASVEFCVTELTRVRYSASRQNIVNTILGAAVGHGMYGALSGTRPELFWTPAIVCGTIWILAAVLGAKRGNGQLVSS